MASVRLDHADLTFRVRQQYQITVKEYLLKGMFRPSRNPVLEVRALREVCRNRHQIVRWQTRVARMIRASSCRARRASMSCPQNARSSACATVDNRKMRRPRKSDVARRTFFSRAASPGEKRAVK